MLAGRSKTVLYEGRSISKLQNVDRHCVNFKNVKSPEYTFCNSEYQLRVLLR